MTAPQHDYGWLIFGVVALLIYCVVWVLIDKRNPPRGG